MVRCCLEHAASVAKTFLTSDVVVVDLMEYRPSPLRKRRLEARSPLPPGPNNFKTPGNLNVPIFKFQMQEQLILTSFFAGTFPSVNKNPKLRF